MNVGRGGVGVQNIGNGGMDVRDIAAGSGKRGIRVRIVTMGV